MFRLGKITQLQAQDTCNITIKSTVKYFAGPVFFILKSQSELFQNGFFFVQCQNQLFFL